MQQAYTFDKETIFKIGKGALIASSGAAAIAFLSFIGAVDIANPLFASMVALLVPTAINAVKEWMNGGK